ncbi:MAG: ribonuclease R [Thermodesulfobacteriota bacterium]|nr:ribonuclease R [Thermodesulfobacteriota bacterium]
MQKKKRFKHKKKDRHSSRGKKNLHKHSQEDSLKQQLLALLYTNDKPLKAKFILKDLDLPLSARKPLHNLLTRLTHEKILQQTDTDTYGPGPKHGLAEGTVDQNAKGFGFVTGLTSKLDFKKYSRDPFLSPENMRTAHHGDKVLIRVFRVNRDGRPEAEVLSILGRSREQLAGFVAIQGKQAIVYPEDFRYPFTIRLQGKLPDKLQDGDAVIVKIEGESDNALYQQGTLIEILGDPDSIDVQMRLVIEKHNLPHRFSDQTITQVEAITDKIVPSKGRLDLRDIQHVTIDGETAKDFDDAIAVQKTRKGYRLYVSIADVSHYVQPGSALDKEAYERGTSIYFPGRVIPMLPERLSNGLCSLVPDEDRYAFTAILDFDRQGHLRKKEFSKSIICSKKRFTYTTVRQILIDHDLDIRREHKAFLTPLKWAGKLATELMHLREQRGSIGFTLPEPFMELDDQGKISSISRTERNFAHKLIEEFMLAANEAVAETFTEQHLDGLYRIHERPSPEKIQEFVEFGYSLGLDLPPLRQDPDWFGQVLDKVKGSPKEYVINNLLLRTMQQARYDGKNVGHFGLAATDYTHFTSPIRRYPDLTVHRTLQTFLQRHAKVKIKKKTTEITVKDMGVFLSARERIAVTAERDMNDRLKVRFMHNKIGEKFQAVVSGVTSSAIFVELLDLFVSGGISLTSLKDDYYIFDGKHHRLKGKHSGRSFQLGDLITVGLLDVDLRRNRIYFSPILPENEKT